jgi:hypothetical protein
VNFSFIVEHIIASICHFIHNYFILISRVVTFDWIVYYLDQLSIKLFKKGFCSYEIFLNDAFFEHLSYRKVYFIYFKHIFYSIFYNNVDNIYFDYTLDFFNSDKFFYFKFIYPLIISIFYYIYIGFITGFNYVFLIFIYFFFYLFDLIYLNLYLYFIDIFFFKFIFVFKLFFLIIFFMFFYKKNYYFKSFVDVKIPYNVLNNLKFCLNYLNILKYNISKKKKK